MCRYLWLTVLTGLFVADRAMGRQPFKCHFFLQWKALPVHASEGTIATNSFAIIEAKFRGKILRKRVLN
jgi:hypothetical protein